MSPPSWTFLSPSPSHPSRLLQNPCLSSLSHTANSRWHSVVHVVYKFPCYSLHTSHPLLPHLTSAVSVSPTPVFLPGKSHGQRSLGDYSPWGYKELDITEHSTCLVLLCFSLHFEMLHFFLQIGWLCQPCLEHIYWYHSPDNICSLRVSVSHFGKSHTISHFFIIVVFVIVICDQWSLTLLLQWWRCKWWLVFFGNKAFKV